MPKPRELINATLPDDPQRRVAAVVLGIERLARRDPRAAADLQLWLQERMSLPDPAQDRINLAIGMALAEQRDRTALVYLRRIQPREDNVEVQQQRLRAALRLSAWADLVHWVGLMPASADDDGEWHYWLARGLARRGDMAGAAHAFADAAGARSLWGFRAAELLGRPPALAHRPAPVDADRLAALLASDTSARIRELQALGPHCRRQPRVA
jgi:soluble lytic murein transglycosylase